MNDGYTLFNFLESYSAKTFVSCDVSSSVSICICFIIGWWDEAICPIAELRLRVPYIPVYPFLSTWIPKALCGKEAAARYFAPTRLFIKANLDNMNERTEKFNDKLMFYYD